MSGIAEILLNLGYEVSGSDLRRSAITDRLAELGAKIFAGHAAAHVAGAGVVVTSSAIPETNPEVVEARRLKTPVIPRAEMLAELMRIKYGIAVAGMHGKTTTTSMIASVLTAGGLDPTVVVGGRVDALGSNACLGRSHYLVAEADESDRSFLMLSPILSVVTNIDREHMNCYGSMDAVKEAFAEFMNRVPFYGATVACLDNENVRETLAMVKRRVFTYGTSTGADYRAQRIAPGGSSCRFLVAAGSRQLGPFKIAVPGEHNVLDATAAVAIADQLEIPVERIADGLEHYGGVDRRFQRKGSAAGVTVIDDYGHHPTEIRATLAAARECGYRHLHVIFQPHRYTRTRDLMPELAASLDGADTAEVVDIYPASEAPIPGVNARALAAAAGRSTVRYAASFEEAAERATAAAGEGDAILTLGAGNISQAAPLVLQLLRSGSAASVEAGAIFNRDTLSNFD